ncbi:MAG TPA: sensor histidine kinase [Novosphingobium sp.]|nr:sensor histidine kinase [Novosphingobium sp.]
MTRFEAVRGAILSNITGPQKVFWTSVVIAAPTALRLLLGHSANPVPFVTYFPAIMLAAVFLGWRWAAIATVASALIVNRLFLSRPWLENPSQSEITILFFFCASCAVLILIGDTLRRAVRETERLSRERDVLNGELYHRVQNVLSVVTALVGMAKANDVAQFREDLLGRILALSKANRVLKDGTSTGRSVEELIAQAVAPFRRDCSMALAGPPRTLPVDACYQLVLILHELCTNALKHGALRVETGRVHVNWTAEPHPFRLDWREAGGPPVAPPKRKGLGSKLFAGQHMFAVEVRYEPAGVTAAATLIGSLASGTEA